MTSLRPVLYVDQLFGVVRAKKFRYDEFVPVGEILDDVLYVKVFKDQATRYAPPSSLLADFTDDQILEAYNAAGYPPVKTAVKVNHKQWQHARKHGYNALIAEMLEGKL